MHTFSEHTKAILFEAGWSDSRSVDTRDFEQRLESEGYRVYESVSRFLESFGGLMVSVHLPQSHHLTVDFHFNPSATVKSIYSKRVSGDQRIWADPPLCVIGFYHRGHMVLMMDEQGCVYGGYDDLLVFIGASGEEAIEAMCQGKKYSPIPPLDEMDAGPD